MPALLLDAPVQALDRHGDYVVVTLDCPALACRAVPGQFVGVRCEGAMLRRPFSIYHVVCDAQGAPTGIALLFKVIGPGTRYMASRRAGDTLNVLGPLGHGLDELDLLGQRVALVAGGYGVAPLDFAAHALVPAGREVALFVGTRALDLLPCYTGGPLEGWSVGRRFAELGVPVHIASMADEPPAYPGTVVDMLLARAEGAPDVLACGSHGMMRATAEACAGRGLRCYVLMEELMGCGVSVCRSCICRVRERDESGSWQTVNKTSCTDGPLFDAATIDWDWSAP